MGREGTAESGYGLEVRREGHAENDRCHNNRGLACEGWRVGGSTLLWVMVGEV